MKARDTDKVPIVIDARYVAEVRTLASLPAPGPVEIGIAGRSNVGKSTLLNRLAARKALARTSRTPGRTRGMIFYDLDVQFHDAALGRRALRLVDLPGYGYAQVSKDERKSWGPLVEDFVKGRLTLALMVVLIDGRRGIEEEERQLIEWLHDLGVAYRVVVTKVDKLSASERGSWKARPGTLLVSGHTSEGVDRLWALLARAVAAAGGTDAAAARGNDKLE